MTNLKNIYPIQHLEQIKKTDFGKLKTKKKTKKRPPKYQNLNGG